MTGHIHTEISTHLTARKKKISTNYVSGLWGNHGAEGNLPVQLGNRKNRNNNTGGINIGRGEFCNFLVMAS